MKDNNMISDYLDFVEGKFFECFDSKGYVMDKPVAITSQIDKTVDFIGSKISPLKHYVLDGNIPEQGVALIQNCMKLRAFKHLKDNIPQTFGSCYRGMGTITKYDLNKIVFDTFDYLTNNRYLGIKSEDIHIRINAEDSDLINSIEYIDSNIFREYNTESIENYKHIYGMDDEKITGRNFNIAIRKKGTNSFFDCAAIIVMENPQNKLAIDMGIGNSSLALCQFNKENTVAGSRIADIININSVSTMKYADSIVAVSTLLYENILNHSSKHFRKKFRQYLNILLYWKNELNISDEIVKECINQYLNLEYKVDNCVSEETFKLILKK